jgi:A/G-specific adenine glycosylase
MPPARPPDPPARPPYPPARAPDPVALRSKLLDWYDRSSRELPFRATKDPWHILVAESMAQQTQAARAGEAWIGFIARFPTPAALAEATPADVLRAWRGLGYNRRAVDLQRAARTIVAVHDGRVPSDLAALEALPGVGPYTARAVAVFAFDRRVGPVDTNVRRVLGRVVLADGPSDPPRRLQALADELVDPTRPADWTHALMDLGATLCRPADPVCGACPLQTQCRYVARPAAPERPERQGRPKAAREAAVPFERTSRWLRGRIVERLRDADGQGWLTIEAPIGSHDAAAVTAAMASLEREGILERHPGRPSRARLSLGE